VQRARSAADLGIELKPLVGPGSAQEANRDTEGPRRPGDWLEHSPVLTIVIVGIGVVYLVRHFTGGNALASLDLNTINLILILLALLLNWRPWRMARAVREGAPAVSGVLLQFPLYGGIFGMIAYTGLSERIAGLARPGEQPVLLPTAHRALLDGARRVRAQRRLQVGHRGSLRPQRCPPAECRRGMDGRRLRPRRGQR